MLSKKLNYGEGICRDDTNVVAASAETEKWLPYPLISHQIKKHGYKNILDIGCGSCDLLVKFCEMNSEISCYGIDISEDALKAAKETIDKHKMTARIKTQLIDFTKQPLRINNWEPEVITFMFVLHELVAKLGEEALIKSLKGLGAKFPGCHLAICELIRLPNIELRKKPSLLAEHYFYHGLSNQKVLTSLEWLAIFDKAGFVIEGKEEFEFLGQAFYLLKTDSKK